MKRPISLAILSLTVVLSATLTGCGSEESSSPSATSPASSAVSSPSVAASSEAPAASDSSSSPGAQTSSDSAPGQTNDSTQVCTDLAKQSAPILMKALKNADKPAEVSAAYTELADLYEAAIAKVDSQDAKDAFSDLAKAYRKIAKDGTADSNELNEANDKFGAACFDG